MVPKTRPTIRVVALFVPFFVLICCLHPIYDLRTSFLSPSYSSRNIRSGVANTAGLFSSPLPVTLTVCALHIYREKKTSAISSLGDSRFLSEIYLTDGAASQPLLLVNHCYVYVGHWDCLSAG